MKSNFLKNIDYKNLVLTILVTLFVFTFTLKISKPLKMFFLLIALFICIYDLRYLVPFLVTFLIINISKKKNTREHFSTNNRDEFESILNNEEFYDQESTQIRNNFNKNLKYIPFFSSNDDVDSIFKEILTLRVQNSELRNFSEDIDNDNKKIYFNRILKRINPSVELLFDMLNLNDNDSLNLNRENIIQSLDGAQNSLNKKFGILFTKSRRREYNQFLYNFSKKIGLSELYNNNLSPERPNLNQGNRQNIINNHKFVEDIYINLRKKLLESMIFIFIENKGNKSINDIIIGNDNEELFEIEFNIENYLENDTRDKLGNLFFSKLKEIFEFDFNCFKTEFIIFNFRGTNLASRLSEYYRENTTQQPLVLSGNFLDIMERLDNSLTNTPLVNKINRYINEYKREIQYSIDSLELLDNVLRPLRDPEIRNNEKLKILFNLYSLIFITNNGFKNNFRLKVGIPNFDSNLDIDFNNKRNNLEVKINNDTLNELDIFYNQVFFNLKIFESLPDYFIPGIFDENLEPSVEPPEPSLDEQPRWYTDSELKKFFDVNAMNDKKENELEKYYRAMDFNNPNLREISKHANIQNSNLKIEKLSFNHVVDNFSKNTFEIIDEIKELMETTLNNPFDFQEFVNNLINILTKEDRELSIGFIFICIGLLMYFIEDSPQRSEISVVDYLSQIKI